MKAIEDIKKQLIFSCVENNPKSFLPYLLSKNVITGMPNKMRFYLFFKNILNCAEKKSTGKLFLKIEKPDWITDNIVQYNLYDAIHKFPRISIEVRESDNEIYINTLPF